MALMKQEPVTYQVEGRTFEGQLVYAEGADKRPGLLMAPNWMGVSEQALETAKQVAGGGYVVLVADLYGKDVRPANADEAGAAMMPLKNDRPLLRRRMQAALGALRGTAGKAPLDTDRLAAFGFCFGGCCALELARDGAPLKAFVSFHGTLDTPDSKDAARIRGKILVLDGAQDPLVPREQLVDFVREMQGASVDWQLVSYAGAVHSFTDPGANLAGQMQYNPDVSARAFKAMGALLDEVFA